MALQDIDTLLCRRRRLLRLWPAIGGTMLLGTLAAWTYFWFAHPLLGNPPHVLRALEAGTLATDSQVLLAAMAPILFIGIGIMLALLILFSFACMANEKRLLDALDSCRARQVPSDNG